MEEAIAKSFLLDTLQVAIRKMTRGFMFPHRAGKTEFGLN
jgi:hypothetical protein